jgi:hypothetical protein
MLELMANLNLSTQKIIIFPSTKKDLTVEPTAEYNYMYSYGFCSIYGPNSGTLVVKGKCSSWLDLL